MSAILPWFPWKWKLRSLCGASPIRSIFWLWDYIKTWDVLRLTTIAPQDQPSPRSTLSKTRIQHKGGQTFLPIPLCAGFLVRHFSMGIRGVMCDAVKNATNNSFSPHRPIKQYWHIALHIFLNHDKEQEPEDTSIDTGDS